MKSIKNTTLLISLFLLASCSSAPMFYHSTTDLPSYDFSTFTKFKLIPGNSSGRDYGVLSATDNDTLHYVVFAPSGGFKSVTTIRNLDFTFAAVAFYDKCDDFLNGLDYCINHWNDKSISTTGSNYEFIIAVEKQTPLGKKLFPTLTFLFQNSPGGSSAKLIFSNDVSDKYITLDKLSQVEDLKNLITTAIKND